MKSQLIIFLQSDREKEEGLPVAPFMDREKVTKPTAQIGFIKFVLIPMFETYAKVSSFSTLLGSLGFKNLVTDYTSNAVADPGFSKRAIFPESVMKMKTGGGGGTHGHTTTSALFLLPTNEMHGCRQSEIAPPVLKLT